LEISTPANAHIKTKTLSKISTVYNNSAYFFSIDTVLNLYPLII
jgi:hypothetical protein